MPHAIDYGDLLVENRVGVSFAVANTELFLNPPVRQSYRTIFHMLTSTLSKHSLSA
jgi:hypothetical protein